MVDDGQANGKDNVDQNVVINTKNELSDLEANTNSSSVEGSSKSYDAAEISKTHSGEALTKNQDLENLNEKNCTLHQNVCIYDTY